MPDEADFTNEPGPGRLIYLSVSPAQSFEPGAVQKQLEGLLSECGDRGIRLDVRADILGGWLEPPFQAAHSEARALLAGAWSEALKHPCGALGMSISHTDRLSAAAVQASDGSKPASIGIDVEWLDRTVDPRIAERIRHPDDESEEVPLIGLWAAKEALLKSDLNSAGKSLRDYAALLKNAGEDVYLGSGMGAGPFWKSLSVQIVDGLVLAIAC